MQWGSALCSQSYPSPLTADVSVQLSVPLDSPHLWSYSNMFDKPVLSNFPMPDHGRSQWRTYLVSISLSQSRCIYVISVKVSISSWFTAKVTVMESPAMHELSPCLGPWSSLWPEFTCRSLCLLSCEGDDLHQFQILFQSLQ